MHSTFNRFLSGLLFSTWLFAANAYSQSQVQATETLALVNATVIDGNGGPPLAKTTVVITGERIADIFPTGRKRVPAGATVIDLSGQYIIPGLIDSHVHLATGTPTKEVRDRVLRFAFRGGITTVRDMGGDAIVLAEMAKAAADRNLESPRIYFSAIFGGPSFFSDPRTKASAHGGIAGEVAWLRAITAETDLAKVIAEARAAGVTGIKVYAQLPADLVAKVTAEAHRQKLKVWSHATIFPAKPGDAVSAGVDAISHSAYLVWEASGKVPDNYRVRLAGDYESAPVTADKITTLLRRMKEKGTVLDATLFVFNSFVESPRPPPDIRDVRALVNWTFGVTKRARELGVTVIAGTDSIGDPDEDAFPNLHKELELLVGKCGFTPLEAITSATSAAAATLGIQDSYGAIQKGKMADLVVLSADPSLVIGNAKKIVYVVKAGRLHKRN